MNANNVSIWNICSILLDRHRRRVKRFDDGQGSRNHLFRRLCSTGERCVEKALKREQSPDRQSVDRGCEDLLLGKRINLDRGFKAAQKPWAEIVQLVLVSGHTNKFFGKQDVAAGFLGQGFKP